MKWNPRTMNDLLPKEERWPINWPKERIKRELAKQVNGATWNTCYRYPGKIAPFLYVTFDEIERRRKARLSAYGIRSKQGG
jgi:hypothetical protein